MRAYEPSMIVYEGYLYAVTDNGIAHCFDVATGDERWKKRLGGSFSSSPTICNGTIYVTNDRGKTFVINASPSRCEIIAQNQLGVDCYASPAVSRGQLFYRVGGSGPQGRQETLYCVARPRSES